MSAWTTRLSISRRCESYRVSVRIVEAVDFIARTAGHRPWVINLSVGRHGGPHDGCTLAELAFDAALQAAPGRFIVQSAGNYFNRNIHLRGRLSPNQVRAFSLRVDEADFTPNEIEVWYAGRDAFSVQVESPSGHRSPLRSGIFVVSLFDFPDQIEAGVRRFESADNQTAERPFFISIVYQLQDGSRGIYRL